MRPASAGPWKWNVTGTNSEKMKYPHIQLTANAQLQRRELLGPMIPLPWCAHKSEAKKRR